LVAAVNPVHLGEVVGALYQSIILGIAAVSSQALAQLTQGLSMGKVAYERAARMFKKTVNQYHDNEVITMAESYVSSHKEWVGMSGRIVSRALGVVIAFLMDKALAVYGACTVGSDMLVNAIEDLFDPLLEKMHAPTIRSQPYYATMLQTSLIVIGARSQLLGRNRLPLVLKVLLSPVLAFEYFLDNLVLTKRRPFSMEF
jgi:hypothetical protein